MRSKRTRNSRSRGPNARGSRRNRSRRSSRRYRGDVDNLDALKQEIAELEAISLKLNAQKQLLTARLENSQRVRQETRQASAETKRNILLFDFDGTMDILVTPDAVFGQNPGIGRILKEIQTSMHDKIKELVTQDTSCGIITSRLSQENGIQDTMVRKLATYLRKKFGTMTLFIPDLDNRKYSWPELEHKSYPDEKANLIHLCIDHFTKDHPNDALDFYIFDDFPEPTIPWDAVIGRVLSGISNGGKKVAEPLPMLNCTLNIMHCANPSDDAASKLTDLRSLFNNLHLMKMDEMHKHKWMEVGTADESYVHAQRHSNR